MEYNDVLKKIVALNELDIICTKCLHFKQTCNGKKNTVPCLFFSQLECVQNTNEEYVWEIVKKGDRVQAFVGKMLVTGIVVSEQGDDYLNLDFNKGGTIFRAPIKRKSVKAILERKLKGGN